MIATLLALVVCGLALRIPGVLWAFYTRPIVLEFAMGMLIGLVWRHAPGGRMAALAASAVLAASLSIFLFGPAQAISGLVLGYGALAAVIVSASLVLERCGVTAPWPWLQRLGDASYAIYLTHFFVIRALEKLTHGVPQDPLSLAIVTILVMGACALIGVVIHLGLEKPLTSGLRRWLPDSALFWRAARTG